MIIRTISLCLLGIAMLAGCSEDAPTSDNTDETPTEFGFAASVNGTVWTSDSALCTESPLQIYQKDIIAWIGEPGLGEKITLSLKSTETGTYAVSQDTGTCGINYTYDSNPSSPFEPDPVQASEGTITVEKSTDTYIRGTFSFKGESFFSKESFEVTGGSFTVRAN